MVKKHKNNNSNLARNPPVPALQSPDAQLLNFHFAPPQRPRSGSGSNPHQNRGGTGSSHHHGGRGRGGNNKKQPQQQQYHRTAEDRASARRKAGSGMFPLHSSPDHAFWIARQWHGRYTWQGPDQPVSWEAVRVVKCLVTPNDIDTGHVGLPFGTIAAASCPICLDTLQCARITKCGHCFCLTCLVHHVQSFMDKTTHPKCPCCSIPLQLTDLRPIIFIPVQPPVVTINAFKKSAAASSRVHNNTNTNNNTESTFTFVKLHRSKECPAPYLPQPDQPRRRSPRAAPSAMDADAPYSRFNYVDIPAYHQLLESNHQELLLQQQHMTGTNMSTLDELCLGLAIQIVTEEQHQAVTSLEHELEWQAQLENPAAGIYLPHPPHLLATVDNKSHDDTPQPPQNSAWDDIVLPMDRESPPLPNALLPKDAADDMDAASPLTATDDQEHLDHSTCNDVDPSSVRGRNRGDSIVSCGAINAANDSQGSSPIRSSTSTSTSPLETKGGSMFLDEEDEYVLYQAVDGSLCFLSGFNMNCLRTEFATGPPPPALDESMENLSLNDPQQQQQQQSPARRPPLPDRIEGRVLSIERVHLTADLRQRRRFLSHLPLYTDLCFVEINLNHWLSPRTKKVFYKEFQKRHQARLQQAQAEQRADERERRQEEARIQERKARLRRIDPADEFFHIPAVELEPPTMTGVVTDGPVVRASDNDHGEDEAIPLVVQPPPLTNNPSLTMSFSQVIRAGEAFPTLDTAPNETNFPALGSSPPISRRTPPPPRPWGHSFKATHPLEGDAEVPVSPTLSSALPSLGPRGKKAKAKKVVLFSTGAQRGGHY